jgi:uncharacterized protein YkuJ
MADAPKESKDQRRARFNREGRQFLKDGQAHLITPQHQAAMDYFTRKDANKNARRKNFAEEGAGGTTVRASGESKATNIKAEKAAKAYQFDSEKINKTYGKINKRLPDLAEENPRYSRFLPTSNQKKTEINNDYTHHDALAAMGDDLSYSLDDAHDAGVLHSKDAVNIDNALDAGHKARFAARIAHETGRVNEAKNLMTSAAGHYYSAAVQMQAKGIKMHADLPKFINNIAKNYVGETRAGFGAQPHKNFIRPTYTSLKPAAKSAEKAAEKPVDAKQLNEAGKKIESEWVEPKESQYGDTLDEGPAVSSSDVMSQQLKAQGYGDHY